ncbi:DUF2782 domain-containing protein [Salinicola endophyticus]|uniref:DUF2782 domain-containing protein n=1 Tax=Salinicola endophyticus TaxID=1949083 RepID=UPI00249B55F3|nr:DUF2782 domain-containing protein [Salinicola endophyticus]
MPNTLSHTMLRALPGLLLAGLLAATALPPAALAQNTPTPEIKTHSDAQQTVSEYRLNGKLYAIRVAPKSGQAYFLYDADGDGNYQRRDTDTVPVPEWVRRE